jgi:hypothetical protein
MNLIMSTFVRKPTFAPGYSIDSLSVVPKGMV